MKDKRVDQSFIAIEKQENEAVKSLFLEVGIDAVDSYFKRTMLMHASLFNNIELVNFALENGSNINKQDKIGYTALHFAVQENHAEIVDSLIKNNLEIDLQDNYGNPALWRGIMNNSSIKIIEKLIINGANPNLKNKNDVAPIDLIDEENTELVQLFK